MPQGPQGTIISIKIFQEENQEILVQLVIFTSSVNPFFFQTIFYQSFINRMNLYDWSMLQPEIPPTTTNRPIQKLKYEYNGPLRTKQMLPCNEQPSITELDFVQITHIWTATVIFK